MGISTKNPEKACEPRRGVLGSHYPQDAPERDSRSCKTDAQVAVETPGYWKCQQHGMSAKENLEATQQIRHGK